jgi:hypothetical protein
LDEFFELFGKVGVFEYVVDGLGVVLEIIECVSDFGGLKDLLDLWVLHGSFGSLFLIFLAVGVEDGHLCFLYPLLTQLILRIHLQPSLIGLQCLMILFQKEVTISLLRIRLDILRILAQGLIKAVPGPGEFHQLDIGSSLIAVILGDVGVASDGLLVLDECLGVFG